MDTEWVAFSEARRAVLFDVDVTLLDKRAIPHPVASWLACAKACAACSHSGPLARSHRVLCLFRGKEEVAGAIPLQIGRVATGRLWRETVGLPRGSLEP